MVHADGPDERWPGAPALPARIGRNVTVGHNCIIHSAQVADDCLIGMNATLLSGARVGRGSIVAAGSVVLEDAEIPPFSLVAGSPAKVKKTYDPDVIERVIRPVAAGYLHRVALFRRALAPAPPR